MPKRSGERLRFRLRGVVGRQDAEQEHNPPADCVIAEGAPGEETIGDRREQEAAGIAALHCPTRSREPVAGSTPSPKSFRVPIRRPIATLNSARSTRKTVRFGEKAATAPTIE